MTNQSTDTSNSQEGISGWLNSTGELAKLVAEEQRPQVIALVLIYIAFLVLIPFSGLSNGFKVLMFVLTSVGLLWLAFFVLPKQAKGVQAVQERLEEKESENNILKTTKTELERQVAESEHNLSDAVSKAYSYLETIADRISSVNEQAQEEEIRNELLNLHHYINVKKREFDSAVARVKSGGQMIETKKSAAASMAADFFNVPQVNSED